MLLRKPPTLTPATLGIAQSTTGASDQMNVPSRSKVQTDFFASFSQEICDLLFPAFIVLSAIISFGLTQTTLPDAIGGADRKTKTIVLISTKD